MKNKKELIRELVEEFLQLSNSKDQVEMIGYLTGICFVLGERSIIKDES